MKITTKEHISNITTRTEAFKWARKVLDSAYPVAVWRLPGSREHYILIDIRRTSPDQELENLNQCFVINPYENSHPPRPTILCGDIVIKICGEEAETQIAPYLSSSEMEAFFSIIDSEPCSRPPLSENACPNYDELVSKGLQKINSGEAEKIVLSRYQDFDLPKDFDPLQTYQKLSEAYPNAFCHLTSTEEYGLWMGASPEKMIAIGDDRFFSTDALAGTQRFDEGSDDLKQVAWRQKEILEQAMVGRYIINCFKKIRLREFEEIGPKTVKAGNLVHLKTEYKVDMVATNSPLLGSTMLDLLHPTSAVCGHPRTVANDFILTHEGYQRELFAGFIGPAGFDGSTRLFVNLRCMKISNDKARLYAGAGITEDSVPASEYSETQYKMQTLLSILGI